MKHLTAFRLEAELLEKLRQIKKKKGLTISTMVNLAVRKWIESGVWKEL